MSLAKRFIRAKKGLLTDENICIENRVLFEQFFAFEEHKLKRQNALSVLDEPCYKTLSGYIARFKNVNAWFNNKPWKSLTKQDIQKVYDDLEEGRILNKKGKRFADRISYYNKIFKSKPFKIAGKVELAQEVMEYSTNSKDNEVRFITEDTFKDMVSVLSNPLHHLLFWLAWDIGENINTLLQLTKGDFIRKLNEDTNEAEYLINLPREKLKRTRQTRSEPTLYPETVRYADIALSKIKENELIFKFGYRQALKVMDSVVKKTGATVMPSNERVRWKDLRSGMACHLLSSGWTTDEVNFRLGHTASSRVIDKYVSYLAIDRRKPKKKIYDGNLQRIEIDLANAKQREKLLNERIRKQGEENELLKIELDKTQDDLHELKKIIHKAIASSSKSV